MTYHTLTMIDGYPELNDHSTLAEAEAFAQDVAREGDVCRVLALVREYRPEDMVTWPLPLSGSVHAQENGR